MYYKFIGIFDVQRMVFDCSPPTKHRVSMPVLHGPGDPATCLAFLVPHLLATARRPFGAVPSAPDGLVCRAAAKVSSIHFAAISTQMADHEIQLIAF